MVVHLGKAEIFNADGVAAPRPHQVRVRRGDLLNIFGWTQRSKEHSAVSIQLQPAQLRLSI